MTQEKTAGPRARRLRLFVRIQGIRRVSGTRFWLPPEDVRLELHDVAPGLVQTRPPLHREDPGDPGPDPRAEVDHHPEQRALTGRQVLDVHVPDDLLRDVRDAV